MFRTLVFILGTLLILYVSWPSLRKKPRTHGFYRFFAFESLLGLLLLNADRWFTDPFSLYQLISWILLFSSLYFVIAGFYLLRKIGEPEGDFEKTTKLVTQGLYQYVRHPLYSSLLLFGWGAYFKHATVISVILTLVATAALIETARVEEEENLEKFGEEYAEYMQTSKRFIPFLY